MKPLLISLPVLWAATLLALANQGEKPQSTTADAKREMAKLQGSWLVVGLEEEGKKSLRKI